jgi:hypothetical protein
MPEVYRMLYISGTTYLTYCFNLKCLDLVWLSICLKNTEKSAESREQKAESREQWEVPAGRKKPTLQVVVGTDLYMALKIGTDTKTVKRGGPPGGAGGEMVPSRKGLLARGRDEMYPQGDVSPQGGSTLQDD